MKLNRKKWYVRWYFWSLGICEEFLDRYGLQHHTENNGTNLCAFMRVILIYAPLALLFNAIAYAGVLASVTFLPIYLFGFKGYGIGVGILVATLLLVWVIICLFVWLKDKREKSAYAQQRAISSNADAASPSFVRVLGRWVVAKKRKVCPLIAFVERDRKEVQ